MSLESAVLDAPGVAPDSLPEIDRLVGLYRQVSRALRANDPANWAEGLTMPRLRALFYLGRSGPVPVGQIAAGLGISQPSATETLEKLVSKGLAERTADPSDRRIVLVRSEERRVGKECRSRWSSDG